MAVMSRTFLLIAAWIGVALVCVALASSRPTEPTVRLSSGSLTGMHFGPQNEVAFLGVPYAAPPVDDLRWKPPQPARSWSGTREAKQFAAPCPQLPAGWLPYIPGKEDCLYLNIWTPRLSANPKLPVIVFFHGGGNKEGYSQLTPLGPALAPLGVVVVTANYRLGPLGFLAHPRLTAESAYHSSGNYGLLDQLQALKWVRANISQFGGDPARVTVMGQSAGSVDICLLMASPLAKGLFQGAIMESGDCQSVLNEDIRTQLPYNSITTTGEASGERLASDLGIAGGSDALRKLRALTPDELLNAWKKDHQVSFDAIVDGWVVPEQPAKTFAEGRQMHIPVLVGSNADEATVFGHGVQTVAQYKDYLRQDSGNYAEQEFQAYPVRSDADVPSQYLALQNDSFAYGAWSLAQAMTNSGQKAYLYSFTFAETGKRAHLGAYHGLELHFLSDSFPTDWEHSKADGSLGTAMRSYWTNFAKAGNPNAPAVPLWPAYKANSNQRLDLGRTISLHPVSPKLPVLQHIMQEVIAEASTPCPLSKEKQRTARK
jgi:para-nitrobenzyl esterase